MSSGLLPDHIGPLVNRLRSGDHLPIALPDVAAVTEVLMRSLESYFKSIDLTLYKECQDLADYIEDARSEISSLSPDHDDSAGIPRAGLELDAIVEATESATDTIMQAAEDIMCFETEDFVKYKEDVNNELMKIFEACSFQDITGQRISKVVKTLNDVEERVGKLISILGITNPGIGSKDAKPILDPSTGEYDDDDLLNGPALVGEGIDQSEIDNLLDEEDSNTFDEVPKETVASEIVEEEVIAEEDSNTFDEAPMETVAPEIVEEEVIVEEGIIAEVEAIVEEENIAEVETTPELDPVTDPTPMVEQSAAPVEIANEDNNKETSQNDIDNLFG
ncbi:MAG: hypothetical protein HOH19_02515 [Kordiimonadaceae bacterium]|jgi:hypothetical protein|nr:hypothetical protein [Kordiimonadaceae bacterium]